MIPYTYIDLKTDKEWQDDIVVEYSKLNDSNADQAMERYLNHCTQLPFYGYHLFQVTHHSEWQMPMTVYLAINLEGLHFMSAEKETFFSFSFLEVTSHVSSPYGLQLGFDDGRSITVKTIKGDEIVSIFIDYKYFELKSM